MSKPEELDLGALDEVDFDAVDASNAQKEAQKTAEAAAIPTDNDCGGACTI